MDISAAIVAKSDQQNADNFLGGPQTFTIENVAAGPDDQPVHIHLAEAPSLPYKPSKSMLRVLAAGWGKQSAVWVGRGLTLYRNPEVKWGGKAVGGIEISHMSHLDGVLEVPLTVARGKKKNHVVKPLAAPVAPVQQVASTPGITAEQWSVLLDAATVAGIENTGAYAAETLGRQLSGWQEITPAEYETIMARINTPAP